MLENVRLCSIASTIYEIQECLPSFRQQLDMKGAVMTSPNLKFGAVSLLLFTWTLILCSMCSNDLTTTVPAKEELSGTSSADKSGGNYGGAQFVRRGSSSPIRRSADRRAGAQMFSSRLSPFGLHSCTTSHILSQCDNINSARCLNACAAVEYSPDLIYL